MFEIEDAGRLIAKIKVVGVGGGGTNAVNSMVAASVFGVEFIAVNTDSQHLESSLANVKVQIGTDLTKGLGAGSNPDVGRQAALDDRDVLAGCLEGADMVFVTAGMGGGTGTGAAPVIAQMSREMGILTVGVVTKPFYYEGRKRAHNADDGVRELKKNVDTLIVIPNDRIHLVVEKGTPLMKSFSIVNDVLRQAVQGISDLVLVQGLINLDFADVRSVMENAGRAVIGMGAGSGDTGAFEAAKKAITNPLLEDSTIEGAKGILINITGGVNMSVDAVHNAASLIHDSAHEDANIILGAVINPDMDDEVRVTVIATGLEPKTERADLPQIKKWAPSKEPISLRGSERVLSKNIDSAVRISNPVSVRREESTQIIDSHAETPAELPVATKQDESSNESKTEKLVIKKEMLADSSLPFEDEYDVPTFLRKKL
ncbi:MAG: cell division protein FtsZ [Nitrospirae bacterium]|nr:cell division protein FtsZ [Nitrospirota bacterium]